MENNNVNEILIGKKEFLDLCPYAKKWKGTWKKGDCEGLSLRNDGVYVVPYPQGEWEYEGLKSLHREYMEHDTEENELPFPCTIDELEKFFKRAGLGAPCTQEELEKFKEKYLKEYEFDIDRVKRLKAQGLPDEEIAAHLKRRNPKISNHRIGNLLPANPSKPSKWKKSRGKVLMKRVKKDKRLAEIAGI